MAAAKRKERPVKGNGEDGVDYSEFIHALARGEIQATTLRDTTVENGTRTVKHRAFVADASGDLTVDGTRGRLVEVDVVVPRRRLTKLEWDEP